MHRGRNTAQASRSMGWLLLTVIGLSGCWVDVNTDVKTAPKWTEITPPHRLVPAPTPAPRKSVPPPPPSPAASPASALSKRAIVAVFDIEDKGVELSGELLSRMSDYLAMSLAAAGAFQIIPRDQLRERLTKQKQESFRQCYEQSCQIEIGRELAAQKTLASVIMKIGSMCLMTSVLYDLKRATSEGGARAEGKCTEDGIVGQIKAIVQQLTRSGR